MTEPLSTDEIAVALETLSEWHREDGALVRVVIVSPEAREQMEEAVMTAADELGHRPEITEHPDGARVALTTPDAAGVTTDDVELAARIDEIVDAARDEGVT